MFDHLVTNTNIVGQEVQKSWGTGSLRTYGKNDYQ